MPKSRTLAYLVSDYMDMKPAGSHSYAEVAEKLGITVSRAHEVSMMAKMPRDLQNIFFDGHLPADIARRIGRVGDYRAQLRFCQDRIANCETGRNQVLKKLNELFPLARKRAKNPVLSHISSEIQRGLRAVDSLIDRRPDHFAAVVESEKGTALFLMERVDDAIESLSVLRELLEKHIDG